ncbi:diguanylate cyclase [Sulfitobacter sabulilitoris]|uniref:diguanylate cyclase n=1 Tax=Sulfitobacter sabulilitoris TaxID=2562655 RepID=A0A5S3PL98_9RHOB|nr:diguanylate cyclase [Sulfitobacter sabulilitoris]TMM55137.1 diguanylate cyclase [Sulfitobacter sabulilitoris]
MQGKILIVDAISTNRIILKVKLAASYCDILQAASLSDALAAARTHAPDLIICAMTLPDGDAASFCTALRSDAATRAIPVLALGRTSTPKARLALLEAGGQDVMMHPFDDALLLARVRSLIRAFGAVAEWQMRDDTSHALGFADNKTDFVPSGHTALICSDAARAQVWQARLKPLLGSSLRHAPPELALRDLAPAQTPDVFVLCIGTHESDSATVLHLLAAIRANAGTRHAGILVVQSGGNPRLGADALDLGADDLMTTGFNAAELALRVTALMGRKRIADRLRATLRTGLQAAVCDPLTGLHNRRYAMPHLTRMAEHAVGTGRSFAVMLADMDHFKRINDDFGHASGDAVLIEAAHRLRSSLRSVDLLARIGGEEFLIVMPATPLADARRAALRLCQAISDRPFDVPGSATPIPVTISIGLALGGTATSGAANAEALLDAADKALYGAKMQGRNQVTLSRPAA